MENLWDFIEPEKIVTPKTILDEQNKYLMEMTKDILYINISEYTPKPKHSFLDSFDAIFNQQEEFNQEEDEKKDYFCYKVELCTKLKKNYGFRIFSIRYSVALYPVEVVSLDQEIRSDFKKKGINLVANTEEEFKKLTKMIINNSKVIRVAKVLMSDQL